MNAIRRIQTSLAHLSFLLIGLGATGETLAEQANLDAPQMITFLIIGALEPAGGRSQGNFGLRRLLLSHYLIRNRFVSLVAGRKFCLLKQTRASRTNLARERERELVQEAVRLRGVTPREALKVMSQLVEFAIKMNKVTESCGEAKDN